MLFLAGCAPPGVRGVRAFDDLPAAEGEVVSDAQYLFELSDDAEIVARLAIESTGEIRLLVKIMGRGCTFRRVLRDLLLEMGWSRFRIAMTFLEIHHSL